MEYLVRAARMGCMFVSHLFRLLRPRGVVWLVLAALALVLLIIPVRQAQRARNVEEVIAAQQGLNDNLWRGLDGLPVSELIEALGEDDARRLYSGFSWTERRSLRQPECRWLTVADLYMGRLRRGKDRWRPLPEGIRPGNIVCRSSYDSYCASEPRPSPEPGLFFTRWERKRGTWALAGARDASAMCLTANSISLETLERLRRIVEN